MALSSHTPLPRTLHFSKRFAFFALSNGVIDRGSKQQSKRSNFRLHRFSFSRKKSKKWIKLIPKTIGNRKKDCAWGCAWGINTTWENLQIEKHKSGRRSFHSPNWLCFSICRFSQVVFIPQAQPHAQSLFLFPIVFGINFYYKEIGAWALEQHSIAGSSDWWMTIGKGKLCVRHCGEPAVDHPVPFRWHASSKKK